MTTDFIYIPDTHLIEKQPTGTWIVIHHIIAVENVLITEGREHLPVARSSILLTRNSWINTSCTAEKVIGLINTNKASKTLPFPKVGEWLGPK